MGFVYEEDNFNANDSCDVYFGCMSEIYKEGGGKREQRYT
jgi:hypothetical protein